MIFGRPTARRFDCSACGTQTHYSQQWASVTRQSVCGRSRHLSFLTGLQTLKADEQTLKMDDLHRVNG